MAKELNAYFTTIGAKLASQIPESSTKFEDYLPQISEHQFSFTIITEQQVKDIINKLENKYADNNTIPNWAYKLCINDISHVLASLYNDSLKQGRFPTGLKTAKVIPIPKTNNSSHSKDFRPISILHTVGKIFEKLVHSQFTNYLDVNDLMSQTQFGFTKRRNTENALLQISEHIYKALDAKHTCVLLLLDFSKAFDVVPHNILLHKLCKLGASSITLSWFQSYLTDRSQYVRLGQTSSPLATITHGVPQGSVLGPLLFNIYTNDFHKCHRSIHSQYADDTAILITDLNNKDLNTKVNKELQNIITWVEANKLCLNLQKTQYLVISNSKSKTDLKVVVKDININRVSSAKLLGVTLDDKLSFKNHINNIVSKLSSTSYALRKIRPFVPRRILKTIYYGLVYPHLLYGICIWGCASDYLLQPLKIIQKKITRIISGSHDYYEHTSPLFKNLSILKLPDIYTLTSTTQIFKIN
ncbi:MAG TPA: reverse transcriptase family protein, partial [Candidatus Eisenbacteria bacterium]|nr:reverse transcriptase family protein [Candidatus Eisenbacteria bacterium]